VGVANIGMAVMNKVKGVNFTHVSVKFSKAKAEAKAEKIILASALALAFLLVLLE